jgi:hypothetical protein
MWTDHFSRSDHRRRAAARRAADRTSLPATGPIDANPLVARLDPDDGSRLLALGCELVWATSWMDDANEVIAPRLGLPQLAVVRWPDTDYVEPGVHWKTAGLVEHAQGRAFVWVDDEVTDADRVWVATHHPGRALLHRVHPGRGISQADYSIISDWLCATGDGTPGRMGMDQTDIWDKLPR